LIGSAARAGTNGSGSSWLFSCEQDQVSIARPEAVLTAQIPGVRATFDGVLFEPHELASRLGLSPREASNPARLAAEAYVQLGDKWLAALSGHYALIVEDTRARRLFAVRDAMGMHPLFYSRSGKTILLSPSTEALLADPRVSRELNRVALAEHLVHRWSDASETYFTAINRVPPGHVLEVDGTSCRLRRYWDPGASGKIDWLRDEEIEQFDHALVRAVRRCLARGRTAIFLSGGFDSISVAAVAVDLAQELGCTAPHALSLGFPDPACNEEFVQRGVADSLKLSQDFVSFGEAVGNRGLLQPAVELAATWPMPMTNLWNPAYLALGRRGRQNGCSTILTGSGGDEWLTVGPFLSADLMRAGDLRGVARFIGVLQRSYRISRYEAIRNVLWTFGAKPLAGMTIDRVAPTYWRRRRRGKLIASTPGWVAPDPELRARIDERAERVLASPQPSPGGFYEQDMRTALDHPLVSVEAEEHFEFGRRVGMSVLHPYWDSDLVELLYRTPPHLLTKGGKAKGLVRDSIAKRFPALGFQRQRKVHATNFYWTTLQREGSAAWDQVGHAATLADLGIVKADLLGDTMAELIQGRHPRESYRIWNVLHLETWARARQSAVHGGA
jgi:asparagine synthase (glutamine-hydrolysing)